MAAYSVQITSTAQRQIERLPRADLAAIVAAVGSLAIQPRPPGCRKLAGHGDVFRVRVRTYRVLYSIDDERIVVLVLKVGHRKDVYRGL